jgi:regulator of protease activity HflC (stomatin/prohibitin superfamily)
MRNVIGNKPFTDVNSKRNTLNDLLRETMQKEVDSWGIDIVRCELKEIRPPSDVQETMNNIIKADNTKKANIDYATALETKADGERRAAIKQADGQKQATVLKATGDAEAIQKIADAEAYRIKMVNESAEKYFVGNAQKLKRFEVTQASLENNSKIVITEEGISPVIVLGKEDVVPITKKEAKK